MGLQFFELSDTRRAAACELIRRRLLSDRARQFLTMAVEYADSTPPRGFVVHALQSDALMISCSQERLAELLRCSVRSVQRMLDTELAPCVSVEKIPTRAADGAGPVVLKTVYVLFLDELETMPAVDPTNEFECLLQKYGPGLQLLRDQRTGRNSDPDFSVVSPVVSDVVSGVVCPVVSDVVSDVVSLMNHEFMNHDSMNERMNDSDCSEANATAAADTDQPAFRFCEINPLHLLAIAGQSVPCRDGVDRVAPPGQRLDLFQKYLADAIIAGRATADDARDLLALFHHTAGRPVSHRAKWLFKVWQNRTVPGKTMVDLLKPSDRAYARELLARSPQPVGCGL